MPAAVSKLDNEVHGNPARTAPSSEQAQSEPRFRVVTRKPLPPPAHRRGNPVRNTLVFAAIPACCLLIYVMFWTLAIRGGYVRDQLQRDVDDIRIEQAELRAEKLSNQAPRNIFASAAALGMHPAERKQYTKARR